MKLLKIAMELPTRSYNFIILTLGVYYQNRRQDALDKTYKFLVYYVFYGVPIPRDHYDGRPYGLHPLELWGCHTHPREFSRPGVR